MRAWRAWNNGLAANECNDRTCRSTGHHRGRKDWFKNLHYKLEGEVAYDKPDFTGCEKI